MPGDSKEATVAALGGKTSGKKLATYLSGYRTSGGSMTGLSTRSVDVPAISPGKIRRAAKAGIISPDWDLLAKRSKKEERKVLLCDNLLHAQPSEGYGFHIAPELKQKLRAAHRVVFDEEAEAHLTEVTVRCADLILEHETFARQPWDPMWIEMPLGNPSDPGWISRPTLILTPTQDRIGHLFDNYTIHTFLGVGDHTVATSPTVYHLHQPHEPYEGDPDLLDQFFLGPIAARTPAHIRAKIRANYNFSVLDNKFEGDGRTDLARVKKLMTGQAGELVRILAMLLLLNRPGVAQYHTKPAGRTFINGKFRPYMSHSTLHFVLDPKPSLHAMRNEQREIQDRAPLRWHPVRDHYCHSKDWREYGAIGCIHTPVQTDENWIPAPDLPPLECSHWVCSQCEGRRWRREYPNGRGSAAVGFVQQDMTLVETRQA
jgi:hypothetical protein